MILVACGADDASRSLRFSVSSDQNATELAENSKLITKYLAATLGVSVEFVPASDSQTAVEMFREGDIDLVWLDGLSGVKAREGQGAARAIAQGVSDSKNFSYFIAHASTRKTQHPNFPTYVRRLNFTFGPEGSTSGHLMPEYFFRKRTGYKSTSYLQIPASYSTNQIHTVKLVESGKCEAGVVNYKVYEKLVDEGELNPKICSIIWKSPTYPDYHWTAHPDLDKRYGEGFIDRLQAALIAIDKPQLLAALPRQKLVSAKNEDYEPLRKVSSDLGLLD
jgi:phosphonate transport system substrate-binding protein